MSHDISSIERVFSALLTASHRVAPPSDEEREEWRRMLVEAGADLLNLVRALEDKAKRIEYLEPALVNALGVSSARRDQTASAEQRATNAEYRLVSQKDNSAGQLSRIADALRGLSRWRPNLWGTGDIWLQDRGGNWVKAADVRRIADDIDPDSTTVEEDDDPVSE